MAVWGFSSGCLGVCRGLGWVRCPWQTAGRQRLLMVAEPPSPFAFPWNTFSVTSFNGTFKSVF